MIRRGRSAACLCSAPLVSPSWRVLSCLPSWRALSGICTGKMTSKQVPQVMEFEEMVEYLEKHMERLKEQEKDLVKQAKGDVQDKEAYAIKLKEVFARVREDREWNVITEGGSKRQGESSGEEEGPAKGARVEVEQSAGIESVEKEVDKIEGKMGKSQEEGQGKGSGTVGERADVARGSGDAGTAAEKQGMEVDSEAGGQGDPVTGYEDFVSKHREGSIMEGDRKKVLTDVEVPTKFLSLIHI